MKWLLILLVLLPSANALRINEIMYNPIEDDRYFEWIELFTNESFDFSNATISDSAYTDEIVCCKNNCSMNRTGYILIVDKDSLTNFSDPLCVDDNSIGNSLGNTADNLTLRKGNLTVFVSYNNSLADGNNHSLEWFNGSWHESSWEGGTPGYMNSVANAGLNDTNNTVNQSHINQTNVNQTTNQTNTTNQSDFCDIALEIWTEKIIYENEAIKFRHLLNNESFDFVIDYWIEDLFGEIVKAKRNTTNLNEKSYTPSGIEGDMTLLIKSNVSVNCTDTNLSNNYAEKMIVIKGDKKNSASDSSSSSDSENKKTTNSYSTSVISKFNYEIISFPEEIVNGDEFEVKVKIESDSENHFLALRSYIYRGSKHYSEEAVEEVTLEAGKEIVVSLKNIVEAEPGNYKLKVKIRKDELKTEYDLTENVTIIVGNKTLVNETIKTDTTSIIENKIETNQTINISGPRLVYTSKSTSAKSLVKYLIIGLLAVISIILIWKR